MMAQHRQLSLNQIFSLKEFEIEDKYINKICKEQEKRYNNVFFIYILRFIFGHFTLKKD